MLPLCLLLAAQLPRSSMAGMVSPTGPGFFPPPPHPSGLHLVFFFCDGFCFVCVPITAIPQDGAMHASLSQQAGPCLWDTFFRVYSGQGGHGWLSEA